MKVEFFTDTPMTGYSEKKNKSHDTTVVRDNPGYKTKKNLNFILKNAIPKAIIKVYSELLIRTFYAQNSISRNSNIVKIFTILIHCTVNVGFIYISFPASTKLIWLVACPTNLVQK